jgi:GGDEF domain-containing protein
MIESGSLAAEIGRMVASATAGGIGSSVLAEIGRGAVEELVEAGRPPRGTAGLDPGQPRAFAERLEAFRQHHRSLPEPRGKGGLFILDIAELGRRFANRWPRARDKAYQLVEASFARRLNPSDRYVALNGERFLLLLTDTERADAELLARRLAGDITERLCGMIPGGVACRLRATTLDPDTGLAGVTSLAELEARLATAEAPAENPSDTAMAELMATLSAIYTPVLNVPKRLVSIYALEVEGTGAHGAVLPAAGQTAATVESAAVLDRWAVGQAAHALAMASFRAAVLIRISYTTIAGMRHRQPLMLACRRLPSHARRRLLIEIAGLPPSLPQARLRELISYLRPFTAGVVVRLDPEQLAGKTALARGAPQAVAAQLTGSGVVGLSLGLANEHSSTGGGGADCAMATAALATLVATARQLRLRTLCDIGTDRRFGRAAVVAGIDHVMGEALLPATSRPGRVIALGGGLR